MLVDLHAHFPMHVVPPQPGLVDVFTRSGRRRWREHLEASVVDAVGILENYETPSRTAGVTAELLCKGGVKVALSPLYVAADELEGFPCDYRVPNDGYAVSIEDQLQAVEDAIERDPRARVAHDLAELEVALADDDGRVCLVHCIEGGFALGGSVASVRANVASLAARGIAYVTLAHLYWRRVATNAPAIPEISDGCYRRLFPQPDEGLSALGKAAVAAMVEHRVTVDVTHMSGASLRDTFAILDELDREKRVAVIASHAGARLGTLDYNLDDATLGRIVERGGVVGLMACAHFMGDGQPRPRTFADSVDVVRRHVDHVAELSERVAGSARRFAHLAIGSDLDGFAKPSLPGLGDAGKLADLSRALEAEYGAEIFRNIACDNALRVLRGNWR